MKAAILVVDAKILKWLLHMPEDFEIIGISCSPGEREIHVSVVSESFPDVLPGFRVPRLQGTFNIEYHPDPQCKEIAAEYEVLSPATPSGNTLARIPESKNSRSV